MKKRRSLWDETRRRWPNSFTKRRSPRGKVTTPVDTTTERERARPSRSRPPSDSYHWAPDKIIETLALRVLYSHGGTVETQRKLYEEVGEQLGWEDGSLRVSPAKMRKVLLSSKKILVDVRYSIRSPFHPLNGCPVCKKPVAEIKNHTLDGEEVVAGYRCTACSFWTPLKRRVPARYVFRATG